jgi:hypothetical protein
MNDQIELTEESISDLKIEGLNANGKRSGKYVIAPAVLS